MAHASGGFLQEGAHSSVLLRMLARCRASLVGATGGVGTFKFGSRVTHVRRILASVHMRREDSSKKVHMRRNVQSECRQFVEQAL